MAHALRRSVSADRGLLPLWPHTAAQHSPRICGIPWIGRLPTFYSALAVDVFYS